MRGVAHDILRRCAERFFYEQCSRMSYIPATKLCGDVAEIERESVGAPATACTTMSFKRG
jgi:hypothetical protein